MSKPKAVPEVNSVVPLLRGTLVYKDDDKIEHRVDADTLSLVKDGWEFKLQKDAADRQLKEVNQALLQLEGAGCTITLDGVCSASLSERDTIEISDPDQLQLVLGGRFQDLVDSRIVHTATDKLKAILFDADHPLAGQVRACCVIKTSESVTYRPVKK
jgi:hypothetical protein